LSTLSNVKASNAFKPFELAVALFFQSSAMLDEIKSFEQPFEALILSASDDLQLLMNFSS